MKLVLCTCSNKTKKQETANENCWSPSVDLTILASNSLRFRIQFVVIGYSIGVILLVLTNCDTQFKAAFKLSIVKNLK